MDPPVHLSRGDLCRLYWIEWNPRDTCPVGISVTCIGSDGSPGTPVPRGSLSPVLDRMEPPGHLSRGDLCRLYWIGWIPRDTCPAGISVACIGSDGFPGTLVPWGSLSPVLDRMDPPGLLSRGDLCRLYWIGWIPRDTCPAGISVACIESDGFPGT